MLVVQCIGRYAGETVEMPYAAAKACLAAGTVRLPKGDLRVAPAQRLDQVPGIVPAQAPEGDGLTRLLNRLRNWKGGIPNTWRAEYQRITGAVWQDKAAAIAVLTERTGA